MVSNHISEVYIENSKIYNIKVREIYGGEADRNITTFQLISIASGLSFIVFSNDNIAIEIFQRER